jgi:antirestriction factor ArdC-like protein
MSKHAVRAQIGQDRSSLYDEITDKIIAELEAGRVPWVRPWGTAAAQTPLSMPKNASTDRFYSGVNILLLWGSTIENGFTGQSWLTFRQALSLGGHVRKGERGTVLSFAVIADYFPTEFAARANGALNLLHFGSAFTMQYGIGLVVEQWPAHEGHYPVAAYQAAFGLSLALQAAALAWFAIPWLQTFGKHFYFLFTPPPAERDSQVGLVAVPLDEGVLEARERMEW